MDYEFRFNSKDKLILKPRNADEERFLEIIFGTETLVKVERANKEIILTRTEKEPEQ